MKRINEKDSDKELISVVVATFNSGRTIERCLKSINDQSYKNIEIIVVDGKNYDKNEQNKCKRIIERYAKYFQDGPERSIQRNRGVKEAKGKYILVIDQDMYLSRSVVGDCYKMLKYGKYSALVIPEISIGEGYWTKCVVLERHVANFLERSENECCRFFKKSDGEKVGLYDPKIVGVEDADFHYKMSQLGKIERIKSFIEHDEGRTFFWNRVRKKYYYSRAFREYLRKNPKVAVKQFFPIKTAYFKHIDLFLGKPHIAAGVVLLRFCEVAAGTIGLIL